MGPRENALHALSEAYLINKLTLFLEREKPGLEAPGQMFWETAAFQGSGYPEQLDGPHSLFPFPPPLALWSPSHSLHS